MIKKAKYYLAANGEFVIENYNLAKPFANFFPGIAGKYGIPMWVFYVNRAQCISSFGIKDKDHSILEFFPANKSWQFVSTLGFRTFIKQSSAKKNIFYEPFHNGFTNLNYNLNNKMSISPCGLSLEEENLSLGLRIGIEYFNIPNDNYAGLARMVSIKNLSRKAKEMQLVDGLAQIVPYGVSNLFLKKLGRTIEAWMQVENLENKAPFYKLAVDPSDRPEVVHIKGGNFYLSFYYQNGKAKIIKPIVDPGYIFGPVTDFSLPQAFLKAKKLTLPKQELTSSKTPSGLSLINIKLAPQEEKTFYAVIGQIRSVEALNSSLGKITSCGYLQKKKEENKGLIDALMADIDTKSSSREFNLYAKQTYLDNILRGGYPVSFSRPYFKESGGIQPKAGNPKANDSIFYLYARKHGDLERDYNKFQLQPVYLSQGNGNYRDMNQNRRLDVWFHPAIKEENLLTFFNLLQTDGFNPLVIKGNNFILKDTAGLKDIIGEEVIGKLTEFLSRPFTLGDILLFIEENNIRLNCSYDEFLSRLVINCEKTQDAEHGEGFWTDHWTYTMDLLDNYLGIYPEELRRVIFEKKAFTFFDNTEVVKPRKEKYLLKDGALRQVHAVISDHNKRELIRKRAEHPHTVRAQYGLGEIYQTNLLNKLLCLLVNKLSSLDPNGCGIEMEADKPNWFDALNGLPGLLGSSICETFELKRLTLFIIESIEKTKVDKVYITEEIHRFLVNLGTLLKVWLESNSKDRDYEYWDKSYSLKEDYRFKTKLGLSGNEIDLQAVDLIAILKNALKKIDAGLAKAKDEKRALYYSYFINELKENSSLAKRLPLFLSGQMHSLRLTNNLSEGKKIYQATKNSELYDKALKNYKVTASLKSMPEEIGRARVFTPGWLENESIWLHMEYKYLLEVLKKGLYEEFYADFKNVLIPFQRPEKYGRSILENSSFIVSSAFPDKGLHGNGFVARLSGSTAEFLNIWLVMNVGLRPFFLNEADELNLRFQPILAGWLFDKKGRYSFNFLSKTKVNYYNPKRKDTFGRLAARIKKIILSDKGANPYEFLSDTIPSPYAQQVRSGEIKQIDIILD